MSSVNKYLTKVMKSRKRKVRAKGDGRQSVGRSGVYQLTALDEFSLTSEVLSCLICEVGMITATSQATGELRQIIHVKGK